MSDEHLWHCVRDAAAILGWHDDAVKAKAVTIAEKRFGLRTDADRDDARGRIDRLWIERLTIQGAC